VINEYYLFDKELDISCKDEAHWHQVSLCSKDSWWGWHRVAEDSHKGESCRYAYQDYILPVTWARWSSFWCTTDGLIPWAGARRQPHGAAHWSRRDTMLCSASNW